MTPAQLGEQLPYTAKMASRYLPPTMKWGLRRAQDVSLLLTRSYRGLFRALNWWDAIDNHFYLGGALMFDDIERLQRQGVRAVINLCAERRDHEPRLAAVNMAYLWLPVLDMCAPSFAQIEQAMRWIQHQRQRHHTIYVHCAAGVGRSATLLACWYIYHGGLSAPDALQRIKSKHPQMSLTRRQTRRLDAFAQYLAHAPSIRPSS